MFFKNLKKYRTFCVVMLAVLLMMPVHVFAAGSYTPIEGVTVKVSSSTNDSMTDGAVTVTAKGSAGIFGAFASSKTATITITNSGTEEATIAFDWTATTVNQLTIDGTVTTATAGSFNKTLAAGGSVTVKIVTAKNSTVNKLEMKNFKWSAVSAKYFLTLQYDSGSVTVDGTQKTSGSVVEVEGTGAELEATGNFVAWVDAATNQVLSTDNPYRWIPEGDITVKAVMTTNACFLATADGKLYDDLNQAADVGAGTVILLNNGTLPADNYTIPSGVTLLIPYDTAGTLITTDMKSYLLTSDAAKVLFRQLTMSSGTSITVESGGSICVGSQTYRQMTGQAGPYGAIVMDSDSNITVESGGTLYTWGYVFRGNNGAGTVTVESGGTMYENIAIMDYPGSASTALELYGGGIFPMRTYTIRNVEVPMTFNSGAKEYVFYSLYSGTLGIFSDNALFIGNDYKAPFQLGTETTLTKAYSAGKQYLTIDGDFWLNSFSITMNGISAATSKTSGFPVPSGYVLELTSGTLTLGDNVILTEGSKMTIASDATVNTNGKKLYVFDATDDAGAVSSKDVHGTAYTQVNEDAVLDINGELNISGGFYTSAGNASIISSGETGRVNLTTVSTATTVRIKTAKAKASTYDVNPAYLQNVNEAYVDTSSAEAGDYYQNIDGYWHHSADEHVVDPDGIKCIYCPAKVVAQTKVLVEGTETETDKKFFSLQEAIENTSDNFITMLADTTESTYTIDKAVTIDLNKFKVEVGGVASNVTVTGIDSGTNGFQSVPGTNLGSINVAAVAPEEAVNGKYYIAITDGSVTTFHRVAVAVTSCQFIYDKPNEKQYIVVQGTFKGTDQSVAELTDLGFKFTDTGSTTAGKSNLEVPSDKNYNGTEWSYYYGRDFDSSVTGKVTVQALMEFGQETTPFMSNPTEDLVGLYKTFLGEI